MSTRTCTSVILRFLTLLLVVSLVSSQAPTATEGPRTLAEELTFDFIYGQYDFGANRFTSYISPRRFVTAQTPVVVRWAMMFLLPFHDARAGCNPKRLSFFATNDTIPPHLCKDPLQTILIGTYAVNYVHRMEYPAEGFRFTQYLASLGLKPLSKSNNMKTAIGWGNKFGARIHNYFKSDGWNVLGEPKENFGHPYADTTGYQPKNFPGVPISKLKYPLRWQPLTQTDMLGNFYMQKHVTPHIGLTARPLLMPRHELLKKKTKGPYRYPNRRKIHPADLKQIMRESRKIFDHSARLTRKRMQEAYFWDNKFYSTGMLSFYYCNQFLRQGKVSPMDVFDCLFSLGIKEGMAMHDATILAWHEKRRHDVARPQTIIRQVFSKEKRFQAFRGFGKGYGSVKAVEWEPLIPAQPHSEYPSGSAMLCMANFEAQEYGLREVLSLGKNETIPPLFIDAPHTALPGATYLLDRVKFTFRDSQNMARRCGWSRLWAGIHFSQSVRDGLKAARGIGKVAHDFMNDLQNGRVPKYCVHCLSS